MFFLAIIIIAVVSVVMSIVSLKKQNSKQELEKARDELVKGRVIFHSSGDSSTSSSS